MRLYGNQALATSAPERKSFEIGHFRLKFPHPTQAKVNSHPRKGLTRQIPHPQGTENSQMPGIYPGEMSKFRFVRRIVFKTLDIIMIYISRIECVQKVYE